MSSPTDHLAEKFRRNQCVILDGGVATELQARGARDFRLTDSDHWGFEALHYSPEAVAAVHDSYVAAGCDLITTDTYGILDAPRALNNTRPKGSEPLNWIELAQKSIHIARSSVHGAGKDGRCAVAFSVGGDVATDDHLTTIKLLLRAFRDGPPDLVLFETLSMMRDDLTRDAIALFLEAGHSGLAELQALPRRGLRDTRAVVGRPRG